MGDIQSEKQILNSILNKQLKIKLLNTNACSQSASNERNIAQNKIYFILSETEPN
jgi:hypothetical protein